MVDAPATSVLRVEVAPEDAGERIERLVARALDASRAEARALCARGAVTLDGRHVKKGDRARAGATLAVALDRPREVAAEPELELDVRLERPDLVVVAKPAGMPSVPLVLGERGTLAGALLGRYPELRGIGYTAREPGLIHRLDTQTSGLLVAARTAEAFASLVDALRRGELVKRYLAVVPRAGLATSGSIDRALQPDPSHKGRVRVAAGDAEYFKMATTHYRVVQSGPRFALVEVDASRAFRHQVRVHLASIGHPIVGDTLYGGEPDARILPAHALHASYIAWAGDGAPSFEVSAEPPRAFLEIVGDASPVSES